MHRKPAGGWSGRYLAVRRVLVWLGIAVMLVALMFVLGPWMPWMSDPGGLGTELRGP